MENIQHFLPSNCWSFCWIKIILSIELIFIVGYWLLVIQAFKIKFILCIVCFIALLMQSNYLKNPIANILKKTLRQLKCIRKYYFHSLYYKSMNIKTQNLIWWIELTWNNVNQFSNQHYLLSLSIKQYTLLIDTVFSLEHVGCK